MNHFEWPSALNQPSILGFGCAGMGSSISSKESLALLSEASALGINYFDTAPTYGLGASENILGKFLSGRERDKFWIATKIGMKLRQRSRLFKPLLPIARYIKQGFAPGFKTPRGAQPAIVPRMSRDQMQVSLEKSLDKLRLEYVDVLLLHAYAWKGIEYENEVAHFLTKVVENGMARYIGISGTPEDISLAKREFPRFDVAQIDWRERERARNLSLSQNMIVNVHSVVRGCPSQGSRISTSLQDALALHTGITLVATSSIRHLRENANLASGIQQ